MLCNKHTAPHKGLTLNPICPCHVCAYIRANTEIFKGDQKKVSKFKHYFGGSYASKLRESFGVLAYLNYLKSLEVAIRVVSKIRAAE